MSPRGSKDTHDRSLLKVEQRPPTANVRVRLVERDRRVAADNRTPAQVWLGDPPADRSALAQRKTGLR
jgi:hypothetical protein